MKIVTACDVNYIPGVIALYNSYKTYASEHEFCCMVHDEETKDQLDKIGVPNLFVHRELLPEALPISGLWPEASMSMYSRLLVPDLFKENKTLWIDADALIVRPLPEVDLGNYPCAGVVVSSPTIASQVRGICVKRINDMPAIHAGVMFYDKKNWVKDKVLERCLEVMQYNYQFIYAVQSVLSLALEGNFLGLPYEWDAFTSWGLPENTIIAHFAGYKYVPWINTDIPYAKEWREYYNNGEVKK
jgi:lipopolysaccharide biosynthesis glycosyltransferase